LTVTAFEIHGQVDFDNLMAVRVEGEQHIEVSEAPVFDFSALENSSSAVVALLVAWYRYAHVRGKVVEFTHVPVEVMNIIEVTELSEVLPLNETAPV